MRCSRNPHDFVYNSLYRLPNLNNFAKRNVIKNKYWNWTIEFGKCNRTLGLWVGKQCLPKLIIAPRVDYINHIIGLVCCQLPCVSHPIQFLWICPPPPSQVALNVQSIFSEPSLRSIYVELNWIDWTFNATSDDSIQVTREIHGTTRKKVGKRTKKIQ